MRIVGIFLNPKIRTGGHRRYLEFFQSASDKGHKIYMILNENLEYSFRGIKEIRLNYNYKKKIVPYSLITKQKVKYNRKLLLEEIGSCDFVVIHGETHLLAGIYIKRLFKSKLLFALRSNGVVEAQVKSKEIGVSFLEKVKLFFSQYKYRLYEKLIARKADILVFQSTFDRDSFILRNNGITYKTAIIPGNIGGRWFDSNFKDGNNSKNLRTLIFVGSLNGRKGVEYLIHAFVKLIKKGYSFNLLIIGKGVLENKLKSILEYENVLEQVSFLGQVDRPLEFIVKADLMIVPSIFDSFPDVILESLHAGTPVIAARTGGIPDMLDDEHDLFEPANSEAIVDKISMFINTDKYYSLFKQRQRASRKRFYFDWTQAFISEMDKT